MSELLFPSEGRTVVLFTQPATCAPCRAFKPHWERARATATEINFVYADLDEHPELMVEFDIRAVPTVKLFDDAEYVRDVKAPQGAIPFISDIRS